MITFKQQFDKLTEAYIKGEVFPNSNCACFVGNLLNGTTLWSLGRAYYFELGSRTSHDLEKIAYRSIVEESEGFYTPKEIYMLENVFMTRYMTKKKVFLTDKRCIDEGALFLAFEVALDHLKKIHEAKGEVIEPFEFKKRETKKDLVIA